MTEEQQTFTGRRAIVTGGLSGIGAATAGLLAARGAAVAVLDRGADADEPGAHYNASKAGVVSLTRQMAIELAPHGIRVNCVCPGVIDTPMLRLMDDPAAGERYLRESVPLRRLGTAAEVAATIAFLASDGAAYITGAALPIDGGSTLL